jgi:hypothetical protein
MMKKAATVLSGVFVVTAVLILMTGCGGASEETSSATEADASAVVEVEPVALELSPEAVALLAMADLADGTEDHVVEKCASCGLGMDGNAENAVTVGEYEMHFCSDTCSRRFEEDAEASILKLPQP